ncbi:MAG: nucleoside kinase [Acidaminococcaceae bacterium]
MLEIRLPDGQQHTYPEGTTLLSIAQSLQANYGQPIVEGMIDGVGKDLQTPLTANCSVDFIELNTDEGMRVYVRSLLYLFITALSEKRPEVQIEVKYPIGENLFCDIINDIVLSKYDLMDITSHMETLIQNQEPFRLLQLTKKEAVKYMYAGNAAERIEVLTELPDEKIVSFYGFRQQGEYFFGPMLPHAGYIKVFELANYEKGILLRFAFKDVNEPLKPFVDQPKLVEINYEAETWSAKMGCATVAQLNGLIRTGKERQVIQVAEALQEKKIGQIADMIAQRAKDVRLVLIAGPSSSGKTTFAQRLSIQLKVNGLHPISLSLDNYFKERSESPRKANGDYDFECLEALDLELFNDHLQRILAGETVKIPRYSFRTGRKEYRGQKITLDAEGILVIEGIHGLNERLSMAVPANKKIKVYISALTHMSFDLYNRIQTTDMRLLRRIVRDSQFRSKDALETLRTWPAVREGEELYIFPFQEDADVMFNTTLMYEFALLKQYAEPLLREIKREEPEYTNAQRLLALLTHVLAIDESAVPNNSIMREFIGNSIYGEIL